MDRSHAASPSVSPSFSSAASGRRPRLHLFDLDGTLIHGSSAAVEISRQLGLDEEINALELAFAAGGMSPPDFAERACAMWSRLTEAHVEAAFAQAPWLAGIAEVWEELREAGDRCAVISLSPDFFVGRLVVNAPPSSGSSGVLSGRGADAAHGSRWPAVPFREPIDPAGILSAAAKVRIADELCAKFGVSRTDCIAYGDSMSDAELFAAVPVSVAVNADRHVRDLASFEYRGQDLREAYGLVSNHR